MTQKKTLFSSKLKKANSLPPEDWQKRLRKLEVKGSDYFRANTHERMKAHMRVFDSLVNELANLGGALFYYADEKLTGTEKQVVDRIEVDTGVCGARMTQMGRNPLPTR